MATKRKAKNTALGEILAATTAGASFGFVMELLANKNDTVSKKYGIIKPAAAGVIGAAAAYLSNNTLIKAAGLGILGLAGDAAARGLANKLPMQGIQTNRTTPMNSLAQSVRRARIATADGGTSPINNNNNSYRQLALAHANYLA